jgi:hypothetical protein
MKYDVKNKGERAWRYCSCDKKWQGISLLIDGRPCIHTYFKTVATSHDTKGHIAPEPKTLDRISSLQSLGYRLADWSLISDRNTPTTVLRTRIQCKALPLGIQLPKREARNSLLLLSSLCPHTPAWLGVKFKIDETELIINCFFFLFTRTDPVYLNLEMSPEPSWTNVSPVFVMEIQSVFCEVETEQLNI